MGYGGLPNEEGILEMDAAYMDGTHLQLVLWRELQMLKIRFQWLKH